MQKKGIIRWGLNLLLVILVLGLGSMTAQKDKTDQLLGSWEFAESISIQHLPKDIKQDLQGSQDLQNHVSTFYIGRQMEFNPNGTLSIVFPNGLTISGTWKLSGNMLTTSSNEGSSASQQIVFVNPSHFYLIAEESTDSQLKVLFPELHFTKN